MNILLLEDGHDGPTLVQRGLSEMGHKVRVASGPADAAVEMERRPYDLVILDHVPERLDGLALVRRLRMTGHDLPILLLTAADSPEDRAAGLDAGADDCVSRPIAFVELTARMNALGRRPNGAAIATTLRAQDIEMNLLRREVCRAGRLIKLQPREFRLLEQLVRHGDRIVTKAMLLDAVWDFDFDPRTNVVETQMSRLRTKLNRGFDRDAIQTVRGAGYMLREVPA